MERIDTHKLTNVGIENNIQDQEDFQSWFKDSVVVDQHGKPLKVFHASSVTNFDGLNLKLKDDGDWSSWGVYFSSDRNATVNFMKQDHEDSVGRFDRLLSEDSSEKDLISKEKEAYLKNRDSVIKTFPCFIKMTHPLILDNHQELMELYFSEVTKKDLEKKYDGIIIKHDNDFTDQYIVFNPDNIKILPSDFMDDDK